MRGEIFIFGSESFQKAKAPGLSRPGRLAAHEKLL
jgi:hypothetical protein